MKRLFKSTAMIMTALTAVFTLIACGGGGGSGSYSTGGVYYTHEQLAAEFIRRVNVDVSGYDLQLMKTNTLQPDYIVVYDWAYGTYDAYWLGNYSVGANMYSYLVNNDEYFYYDLAPQGGNIYKDVYTGILFEKVEATSKDLGKMQALKQEVAIESKAKELRAHYGLSVEKSLDTARFAYNLKTAPAGTYSQADYDAYAKELTGSTITEFQNDYKNNDVASLAKRIETAGEVSGAGVTGVNDFIQEVFFSQK